MTQTLSTCDPVTVPVFGEKDRFVVRRIYCVGRNYAEHAREMGFDPVREEPFFFLKPTDAIVPSGATIAYPRRTSDFQHEIELIVAVGQAGRDIPVDRALHHVFGYAAGIDLTRRDLQIAAREKGRPWEMGKAFDQSAPCGTVRRAAEVEIASARIWLSVNGEVRQDSDLGQLIWSVAGGHLQPVDIRRAPAGRPYLHRHPGRGGADRPWRRRRRRHRRRRRDPADGRTVTEKLAIVGAGIAGLSLALHLHRRGIACQVFEAAPVLQELGVGITLLPHAMRELSSLGLEEAVRAIAIENRESAFFNRFGQKIFTEPRGRFAGYAYPEFGVHRGRLHMLLYRAVVDAIGSEAVVTGHRCEAIEQDEEGVTIRFAGGRGQAVHDVRATAVVACDGINSAVRKKFYPSERLCYTGIRTWRGVTQRMPILDGQTYMRIGSIRTGKIVVYPIAQLDDGRGQLINWVAEVESDGEIPIDWNRRADFHDVLPLFAGWRFDWLDVERLVRDADTILEYPMVDRDPVARWTFGRATLAGDAAHPMYPRGSNGSAQALIDASVLADQITVQPEIESAFRAYEALRLPPTAEIIRTNRASPPDLINMRVEDLTGDRPFEDLDAIISQDELRAISDSYKAVAGFTVADVGSRR